MFGTAVLAVLKPSVDYGISVHYCQPAIKFEDYLNKIFALYKYERESGSVFASEPQHLDSCAAVVWL